MSGKLINIETTVIELDEDVSTAMGKFMQLEKQITDLTSRHEQLETKVNNMDQASLATSFRITGFPKGDRNPANCLATAVQFFRLLNVTVEEKDFKRLYLQNYRSGEGSQLVGTFYNEQLKVSCMKKFKEAKKTKPIMLSDVLKTTANNRNDTQAVVFRNMLTLQTRVLLNQAKQHMDVFKFVWEDNGKILGLCKNNRTQRETHQKLQRDSRQNIESQLY